MLLQRCSRIMYKQIFERRTAFNSLQTDATRSFYGNHNAIKFFIRYLRKRILIVDTPLDRMQKKPKNYSQKMMFNYDAANTHDFWTFNLGEWWHHKKDQIYKVLEEYQYEETIKLGPDIAAAKFIINFGGKVKLKDHDDWIDKTKKTEIAKIPKEYDPNYILDGLDVNGYALRYEHLYFISNLYCLKQLILRGCRTINDWSLDNMSAEYPMLEYLDISECENVTERGLEALYRMPNLKKLVVTNHYGSAAFDLTCLMLEDVNPYLTCEIQQPKHKVIPPCN